MLILVDTRQRQPRAEYHPEIQDMRELGHETQLRRLPYGDYMTDGAAVAVDTKSGMHELVLQMQRPDYLSRLVNELLRAQSAGVQLVMLIGPAKEDGYSVTGMDDLRGWENPTLKDPRRLSWPVQPLSGEELADLMEALTLWTGVRWEFCTQDEMAGIIVDVLSHPSSIAPGVLAPRVWRDWDGEQLVCSRCGSVVTNRDTHCQECGSMFVRKLTELEPREIIRWAQIEKERGKRPAAAAG